MNSVIVVLGKGVNEDGTLTKETKRSVEKAIETLKVSNYDAIIMSGRWGYSLDYVPRKTESEAMREYAVKLGIQSRNIYIEDTSLDTLGNAYYTKNLLKKIGGAKSITVITVDFHKERSEYIFGKIFGTKIKLNFIISDTKYLNPKVTKMHKDHEIRAIATIKSMLDYLEPGNDEQIRDIFDKMHPLYTKDLNTVPDMVRKAFEAEGKENVDD